MRQWARASNRPAGSGCIESSAQQLLARKVVPMTQEILKRVGGGHLPMHFFTRADIDGLQDLRAAGYLKVRFGPLTQERQTSAPVTEVTTPARAALRYLGYGFEARHRRPLL